MKSVAALVFTAAAAVAVDANVLLNRGDCTGNNCNRAVTGTRDGLPPIESRKADCSSFQLTTVTPDTVTVIITETPAPVVVTVTTTTGRWIFPRGQQEEQEQQPALHRRAPVTVIPTAIPAYASPCVGAAAYKSACSCWGVPGSVSTAPAPVFVTTTTLPPVTSTTTATAAPTRCAGATVKGCRNRPLCVGSSERCDCTLDVEGNGVCFQSPVHDCGQYPSCAANADCPSGQACVVEGSTCCPGSYCQPIAAAGECPNQAVAARRALLAGAVVRRVSVRGGQLWSDLDE